MKKTLLMISTFVLCLNSSFAWAENERTMLVLDASGSMWGQLEGRTKIEIAREALKNLVKDWPEGREAGLVTYGHRQKGDCADIETLIPIGPVDAGLMGKAVDALNPKGKTPLSAAVKQAAEALKYTEDKATVVLLSDGKETCNMDPCALGTELEKLGVDFTAHVIGFDVSKQEDQAGLRCLAENTGGQFIPATNATELHAALEQTAKATEPAPEPTPEPTTIPTAELKAPESAIKGTELLVELNAEDGIGGYIYLFPEGKDKYIAYGHVRPEQASPGYQPSKIRLPAVPGKFLLKWVSKDKKTVASAPLIIEDAEVSLDAPDTATKGTAIEVGLNAPEGMDGYIYLFPKGKEKSIAYGNIRAGDINGYKPAKINLPAVPGEFMLKWVTKDKKVIAEKALVIEDAEVILEAPESATMGTALEVGLNAPEGLSGYIYLFPKGKEKSIAYGNIRAADINGYKPSKINLPAVPGEFTLKWVTKDKKVIAEKPLLIEAAEVSLDAPESAVEATELKVVLNAPDGLGGYIYLFPAGKDKSAAYGNIRADAIKGYKPSKMRLPAAPGEYTLKWVTRDKKTIAETALTITDAEITLGAPEQAETGTDLPVTLDAPDGLNGYIHLFPKGKEKSITYGHVRADSIQGYKPSRIKLPEQSGEYVLKWLTRNKELLAEQPLQVVEEITETSADSETPTDAETETPPDTKESE